MIMKNKYIAAVILTALLPWLASCTVENVAVVPQTPQNEQTENADTAPVKEEYGNKSKKHVTKKKYAPENAAKDACGDDVRWHFDQEDSVLYITGSGRMWDYEITERSEGLSGNYIGVNTPWYDRIADCSGIDKVVISDGVTYIGDFAFFCYYSVGPRTIEIPDSVTEIGDMAFWGCDKCESLTLPEGIVSVGDQAFAYMTALDSIELPDSLVSVGDGAFSGCEGLESFEISENIEYFGDGALMYCSSLGELSIADNNNNYVLRDGALYDVDQKVLIWYSPVDISESFTVPDGVEKIANGAFAQSRIKEAVLPEGLLAICDNAFERSSVSSVNIPESTEMIGDGAFYNCSELDYIYVPKGVKSIGFDAFGETENVEIADGNRFYTCENGVLFDKEKTRIYDVINTSERYVIPGSVTEICEDAFRMESFRSLTVPKSVVTVHPNAFTFFYTQELYYDGSQSEWEAKGINIEAEECFFAED